jgi:hypothetical protein
MKRLVLLSLLALALPLAAYADTIDFGNNGGTITASSSSVLTLSGDVLGSITGLGTGGCSVSAPCGTITFTTGALMSGNLQSGGVFSPGGTITITGNGKDGVPNGVIFSGAFTGDTSWIESGQQVSGNWVYYLNGTISGTYYVNGKAINVTGATTQVAIVTGPDGFTGSAQALSGDTFFVTPEPGTLGLLGTGLVGLAGIVRKKYKA